MTTIKSQITNEQDDYICQMPFSSNRECDEMPEAEANARLIAAAPELLEACKAAYEILSDMPGGLTPAFNAAYECRNAIARAEGR